MAGRPSAPPPRRRLPPAVYAIATAAAVLVAFAASPLPRITPDSAAYLTGAERIAESGRYESCEREVTDYAPGYPVALAGLVVVSLDAPDAARVVNVLATAVLVLAAAALALAAGLGTRATLVVALVAAIAPVTLRNGAAAWSEPLFSALLVLLLLVALDAGRGLEVRFTRRLALVLALAWALLLVRYSGLFVVPALVVCAWLGTRGQPRRLVRVALFGGAVLAVPALWYARNVHAGTGPFGSRSGSRYSVLEVLGQVPDGLSSVLLPVDVPAAVRILVLLPLLLAAALALRSLATVPLVLATTVAVYTLGVTVAAMRTLLDPVDARLLSPVLVPAAVLVALGVEAAGARPLSRLQRFLRAYAVAVVAVMALVAPGVAWYLHDAERALALDFPVDCADWPALYPELRAPPS